MTAETSESTVVESWIDSVETFVAEADWLTGADKPQLTALRAIARELDSGKFQAALISQFTLIHRGLLARRPGDKPSGPGGGAAPYDTPMQFPDPWRADA